MTDILKRYDALLASGELKPDPEQAAAARRLADLATALQATPSVVPPCGERWAASPRHPVAFICGAGSGAANRC